MCLGTVLNEKAFLFPVKLQKRFWIHSLACPCREVCYGGAASPWHPSGSCRIGAGAAPWASSGPCLHLEAWQLSSVCYEQPGLYKTLLLRHVITEEYKIWFCWKHFSWSHNVEQLWFKVQSQASGQMCDLSAYCLHAFTWALDLQDGDGTSQLQHTGLGRVFLTAPVGTTLVIILLHRLGGTRRSICISADKETF